MELTDKSGLAGSKFEDPFLLPSREHQPTNLRTALDYCLYLYMSTPLYRRVSIKTVSHFVTRLGFRGDVGDKKERKDFEEFFVEELGGLDAIQLYGEEWAAYGNAFQRVAFPFKRTLVDRRNGLREYSLSMFPEGEVKFNLQKLTYQVPDPMTMHLDKKQRRKIDLTFRDQRITDHNKIRLRCMDPRQITLRFNDWSGRTEVIYGFTDQFRQAVTDGALWVVNDTPIDVLTAVKEKSHYLFDSGAVEHLRTPTVSGISYHGWGLPEILAQYPTLHKIAVYEKIDETIGLEHMLPYRIVTPDIQGINDNSLSEVSGVWKDAISRMFSDQRLDRTAVHSFPWPIAYQELGGQGKALSPKESREYETSQLLNGMGYPVEFFQSSLSVQQMPTAIRMFEQSYRFLQRGLSHAVKETCARISKHMYGEAFDVFLQSPAMAADLERRGIYLQMYAGGQISGKTALETIGVEDPVAERVTRAEEDLEVQEKLSELEVEAERKATIGSVDDVMAQEAQAQAQQGGGGGGSGTAPAGQNSTTPLDLRSQAEQLANEWITQYPTDGQRSQAMQQVRATSPDLYAVAKDIMEQKRRGGASAGRAQTAQLVSEGQL